MTKRQGDTLRGLVHLAVEANPRSSAGELWAVLVQERDIQYLVTIPRILRCLDELVRSGALCRSLENNVARYEIKRHAEAVS